MRKPKEYEVRQAGDVVQLDALEERMSFPVKAIQVDGGAEFETEFERGCEQRGIRLWAT